MKTHVRPVAAVCEDCFDTHQRTGETTEDYYCPHNEVWAIRQADGTGWIIATGVTRERYRTVMEEARRQLHTHDHPEQPPLH